MTAPFDSTTIDAVTVQGTWGAALIDFKTPVQSRWQFAATIPFTVTVQYGYHPPTGADGVTAPVKVGCVLPVPSGSHPVTSTVTLVSPVGTVQAGDSVSVAYTANADAGLWQTLVVLTGACDAERFIPEGQAHNVARTVSLAVPSGCIIGGPLRAELQVEDVGLQRLTKTASATLTFADTRPPTSSVFVDIYPLEHFAGDFFTGETLDALVYASDDNALKFLKWQISPGGFRDSSTVTGRSISQQLSIPLGPQLLGPVQVQVSASDMAGLDSPPHESAPDSVVIYPSSTPPAKNGLIQSAGVILDGIVDPARGVAYLLEMNYRQVKVVSLASGAVVSTIQLPGYAPAFDITPSGDSLLLALPTANALGIVDLLQPLGPVSLIRLTTPDSSGGQAPYDVRTLSNGKVFVHLRTSVATQSQVLEVALATGTETIRSDAGVNGAILAFGPGSASHGVLSLVTGPGVVQRYDAGTDGFGPATDIGLGLPGGSLSIDGTGQEFSLGTRLYNATLQPTIQVHTRPPFYLNTPSILMPDGQHLLYGQGSRGIFRTRVSDGALVDRIVVPFSPDAIRVSADGNWLVGFTHTAFEVVDLR